MMKTTFVSIGNVELEVSYTCRPAEPDVGIFSEYAEDCAVIAIDDVSSTDARFAEKLRVLIADVPDLDELVQAACNEAASEIPNDLD